MPKLQKKSPNPFAVTRQHHYLETAEDYTELIADLIEKYGEARQKEIAKHMALSHVTVLRTLQRLQRDGYVEAPPRHPITLTQKGKELASFSKRRHQILLQFLLKIGVPHDVSIADAEGIEHHISKDTLNAIQEHLKSL